MDLRQDRLDRLTDDPDFFEYLERYLKFVEERVRGEIKEYPQGDMATMGLPGRVGDVLRKAWRVWSFVIKGRRGKGDLEEELGDLAAYNAYLWIYYHMLKERGPSPDKTYVTLIEGNLGEVIEVLRKVLIKDGILNEDTTTPGPELLAAAEEYLEKGKEGPNG